MKKYTKSTPVSVSYLRLLVLLLVSFGVMGCAQNIKKTSELSLGMSKAEVIELLGQPSNVRASQGREFLIYQMRGDTAPGTAVGCGVAGVLTLGMTLAADKCRGGAEFDYYVELRDGVTVAYGLVGDFDSTNDPTLNLNINTGTGSE